MDGKTDENFFNIIFIDFPSNLTKIGLLICFYGKPLTSDADLTKKARLLVLTSDPDWTKKARRLV